MKNIIFLLLLFPLLINAQESYELRGKKHLLGKIELSQLLDTPYVDWYQKQYDKYDIDEAILNKIKASDVNDIKVEIFLGTWCGDSKKEVPAFLKIAAAAGIPQENIQIFALDNRRPAYKQSPDKYEKGKRVHRVPVFIFSDQNNNEIGRIVEHPVNCLEQDMAFIYDGMPTKPNYELANTVAQLMLDDPQMIADSLSRKELYPFRKMAKQPSELNTLGYVFLAAEKYDEAIFAFRLNTMLFPWQADTYDSLAEGYLQKGNKNAAIDYYMQSYAMDTSNVNAIEQLKKMMK